MSFPPNGPTSRDLVKIHLGITDDYDNASIDAVVVAVNVRVLAWPVAEVADTDPPPASWNEPALGALVQGSTMLAARLFRRRNTPDGVSAFADLTPVYVQRNDPDVALLLNLGPWARPAVG